MSDTIELWELCRHGQAYAHDVVIDGSGVRANATMEHCDGGKKRVFQQQEARAATSYLVWVEVADE